jgi:glucose-6-phosphate dehydrogenase assembly protein OpcA
MEDIERVGSAPITVASLAGSGHSLAAPEDEIELERVERELAALWAAAAPDDPGAEAAVMRACALNLLVLGSSQVDLDRIRRIADQTTLAHPSRILLLAPDGLDDDDPARAREPGGPDPSQPREISARISTFCHRPGDGRRHVCCEEITVMARGAAAARLPESIMPLLLPDLPVHLWLPNSAPHDPLTLKRLVALADQVIWSARRPEERLEAAGARLPVGVDLDWLRLLPWRELTAQRFDGPERRERLDRIEAVEVQVTQPPSDRPGMGWLWIGWMGSRLGWEVDRPAGASGEASLIGQSGSIAARVLAAEAERVPGGEICRLCLHVRGCSEPLVLERLLSEEPGFLSVHENSGRCVHLGTCDEAALLREALNGAGRDPIYEAAWEQAVCLFGPRSLAA